MSIIVSYLHVDNADGFAIQIEYVMDELFVSLTGCSDPSIGRRNRKYRQAIVITVRLTRNDFTKQQWNRKVRMNLL